MPGWFTTLTALGSPEQAALSAPVWKYTSLTCRKQEGRLFVVMSDISALHVTFMTLIWAEDGTLKDNEEVFIKAPDIDYHIVVRDVITTTMPYSASNSVSQTSGIFSHKKGAIIGALVPDGGSVRSAADSQELPNTAKTPVVKF
ncbi:hypothetical protein Bbelb_409410 [Branchiostoma belcheri]|nr:hypothetical protein Bbelb_409410 [Branchiostoma belcheri]